MNEIMFGTQPYLVCFDKNTKVFIDSSKFSIGRGVSNSYVIEDLKISRTHCVLEEKGGKWYLIDVSTNGTNVGNKKIEPNVPYELTTGDVIQLCDLHEYAFVHMNKDSLDDLEFSPPLEEQAVPAAGNELEVRTTDIEEQTDADYRRKAMPQPSSCHSNREIQNNPEQSVVPASDSNQNNSTLNIQNGSSTIEFEATARFRRILDEPRCTNGENEGQHSNRRTNLNKTKSAATVPFMGVLDPTIEELMAERMGNCETKDPKTATKVPEPAPGSSGTIDQMEDELQCSICTELFIRATTLNCSHSFCKYCLGEWQRKSNKCPICRTKISTANPTIVLDNFIAKVLEKAAEEVRHRREEVLREREKLESRASKKPPRQKSIRALQRVRIGVPIEISSDDDDYSDEDDEDFMDYTESDEAGYNGMPGVYYGGYGHCYSCGERGHWANGCPYR